MEKNPSLQFYNEKQNQNIHHNQIKYSVTDCFIPMTNVYNIKLNIKHLENMEEMKIEAGRPGRHVLHKINSIYNEVNYVISHHG